MEKAVIIFAFPLLNQVFKKPINESFVEAVQHHLAGSLHPRKTVLNQCMLTSSELEK